MRIQRLSCLTLENKNDSLSLFFLFAWVGLNAVTCPVLSPRAFQRACETSVTWLPGQKYKKLSQKQDKDMF